MKFSIISQAFFIATLTVFLSFSVANAQINITPANATNNTINDLVQSLVGDGVVVQNIVCNYNPPFTQGETPLGKYSAVGNPIGLPEGIVLSTGDVTEISNPSNNFMSDNIADGNNGLIAGDQLLGIVLDHAGTDTSLHELNNVVSIEFDIIPSSDTISFRYVFGSEEYPGFVCSNFNDVFGFFISGPGIQSNQNLPAETRNLALLPGSNQAVSINSVNGGVSSGTATNCVLTNTAFYNDNEANSSAGFNSLTFDGHTVVLEATAKVIPCQVYRLRLSIADVADGSFDSGVFIEKGSLRSFGATVEKSFSFARFNYAVEGCNNGALTFKRVSGSADTLVINYQLGGTATNGIDYGVAINDTSANIDTASLINMPDSLVLLPGQDSITVSFVTFLDTLNEGMETVTLTIDALCSFDTTDADSAIIIPIYDFFQYDAGPPFSICLGDTTGQFNGGDSTDLYLTDVFKWRQWADAEGTLDTAINLSCDTCPYPFAYPDTTTIYEVELYDAISTCTGRDSVKVTVFTYPDVTMLSDATLKHVICFNDNVTLIAEATVSEGGLTFTWDDSSFNQLPTPPTFFEDSIVLIKTPPDTNWYRIAVANDLGCTTYDSIRVDVVPEPEINYNPRSYEICFGDTLPVTPIDYEFVDSVAWFPPIGVIDTLSATTKLAPRLDQNYVIRAYRLQLGIEICNRRTTLSIEVGDSLHANFSVTYTNDTVAPSLAEFTNLSFNTQSYQWQILPDTGTLPDTTAGSFNFEKKFYQPGNYIAKLLAFEENTPSAQSCYDSLVVPLYIKPEKPWLPNIITPGNVNNKNDVLKVKDSPPGEIWIYNRWGQQVYHHQNYQNQWDAKDVTSGVYFVVFVSPNAKIKVKQWVQVMH